MKKNKYIEKLVRLVKASGQEVIDRASDLVGDGDLMTHFEIVLTFDWEAIPEIEVRKSYISKKSYDVLTEVKDE